MAKAILGGIAAAGKTSLSSFNIAAGQQAFSLPASSEQPPLPSDLTASIAGLIKDQIRMALSQIAAALHVHPAPLRTVLAQGKADSAPAIDALAEADAAFHSPGNLVAAEKRSDTEPLPTGDGTAEPPKRTIAPLLFTELEPLIFVVGNDDRSALGKEPWLQRPGFYLGAWERTAYVGMGERVGLRASTNPALAGLHPALRIICIAEAVDRLTPKQALVGERLLAQMVQQGGELTLSHKLPCGAPIAPEQYDQVRLFVARACSALRQAGVLFTCLPAAALLLPAAKPLSAPALNSDTPIFVLSTPPLRAHLAEHHGEWRLLRGSAIRADVRPTAYGPAAMGRAELLHSGGLLRTGPVLTLTQDLTFSSAWAAAHFVLGDKPRSDVWKPLPPAISKAHLPHH